jgi:hypothetical protein
LDAALWEGGIDPFPEPTLAQAKKFKKGKPLVIATPGMSYGR